MIAAGIRTMTIRQGRPRTRVAVFACVAVVALGIDQVTKLWAQTALSDGRTVPVIPPFLSLTLVHNPGASLGLGSSMTWVISLLAVAASIALIVLALRTSSMRWTLALALAFAGAFGNLIDRVAYADGFLNGKVIDFLNYGWSVGNVADIWLMLAGIGIVILIMMGTPFEGAADVVDADVAETVQMTMPETTDNVTSMTSNNDGRDTAQGGSSL
ncbi:lipoprotein signal peptidase [Bifidobacterium hapali]|uniref:Lipoprotein signal peptidase n=2 Tax=Bifidobacterium hapali TaxID=1630172 RepID=A0A261G4K1_9BIFI|nr:lipoprotein signal peptidase [Bifidobacterium hapali]